MENHIRNVAQRTPNSLKSRYTFKKRVPATPQRKHGKKNVKHIEDEFLQNSYMQACCEADHIRNSFTYGYFASRRRLYLSEKNEASKSRFIDRLLDSAIRTEEDTPTYKLYIFLTVYF